jgi:hypothetical protein
VPLPLPPETALAMLGSMQSPSSTMSFLTCGFCSCQCSNFCFFHFRIYADADACMCAALISPT